MNSRKVLIFFFSVCAISFLLLIVNNVDACEDGDAIGRIIGMNGVITVNDTHTRIDATLCLGDVIQTGPNSRADVKLLESNTVFRIEQQSELRLLVSLIARSSLIDPSKKAPHL